jgi:hypothetical protein
MNLQRLPKFRRRGYGKIRACEKPDAIEPPMTIVADGMDVRVPMPGGNFRRKRICPRIDTNEHE